MPAGIAERSNKVRLTVGKRDRPADVIAVNGELHGSRGMLVELRWRERSLRHRQQCFAAPH